MRTSFFIFIALMLFAGCAIKPKPTKVLLEHNDTVDVALLDSMYNTLVFNKADYFDATRYSNTPNYKGDTFYRRLPKNPTFIDINSHVYAPKALKHWYVHYLFAPTHYIVYNVMQFTSSEAMRQALPSIQARSSSEAMKLFTKGAFIISFHLFEPNGNSALKDEYKEAYIDTTQAAQKLLEAL